jgi:hypothetical protein
MMLIPAIPRQPAADLLAYAQEAVTIGRSLIAEGGRQDGDLRLPTLGHPPDAVEKQTPFLLVTRANHETGRGTFDLSGPLASGPDRAQAKTRLPAPGSRQNAQKAQGVRGCKIDISSLRTTASNAAQFTTCCPICCGQPEAKDVRTIVNFVMAVTARVAEPGTC